MKQFFGTMKFLQIIIVFICCVMLRNAQSKGLIVKLGDSPKKRVNESKPLGVSLDGHLLWNHQIQNIVSKSLKESLVNATTDFAYPRSTNVVHSLMRSSETPLLSQTVIPTQRTTIATQGSKMKATRTVVISSMTENTTTAIGPKPATRSITNLKTAVNLTKLLLQEKVSATRTIFTSSLSANTTNPTVSTSGPITSRTRNLGLIFGIAVGTAALLTIICLVMCYVWGSPVSGRKCVVGKDDQSARQNENQYEFDEFKRVVCEKAKDSAVDATRLPSLRSNQPQSVNAELGMMEGLSERGAFYNDVVLEDEVEVEAESRVNKPKERRTEAVSTRNGLVRKIITTEGGVTKIDDMVLTIGPGCLENDTEIKLIRDDQKLAFQSLLNLDLIDATPRVVEFLPDGLKFRKPAVLSIKYEKSDSDYELFLLHGSFQRSNQKVFWKQVNTEIEDNTTEGVVNVKIDGFCFYCYFVAVCELRVDRLLSHINRSFLCCAYAFYRRRPGMDTIDISIVLVSEFIDENDENLQNIKQIKDHIGESYIKSEKGFEERVCTDTRLEIFLTDFSGFQQEQFSCKVDQCQLDKNGFVVNHFKGRLIKPPARGNIIINQVDSGGEVKSLWKFNILEKEREKRRVEETFVQSAQPELESQVQSAEPDLEPQVVYRTTRLSNGEMNRLSNVVGVEWDSLAGLMNIPYCKREEIRSNNTKYPDVPLKVAKILTLYNQDTGFCRHNLAEHFDELERNDWINEIKQPVREEHGTAELETQSTSADVSEHNGTGEVEAPPSPPEINANESLKLEKTPLSSREMFRLSKRISADWNLLAAEMNIPGERRSDIGGNVIYTDNCSKAEKILSIFNNRKEFSREKLARILENVGKPYLRLPVITGEWRSVHINGAVHSQKHR